MPRVNPPPVRLGAAIRCRPWPLPREGPEGQSPRRVGWEPVRLNAQGRKGFQGGFNVARRHDRRVPRGGRLGLTAAAAGVRAGVRAGAHRPGRGTLRASVEPGGGTLQPRRDETGPKRTCWRVHFRLPVIRCGTEIGRAPGAVAGPGPRLARPQGPVSASMGCGLSLEPPWAPSRFKNLPAAIYLVPKLVTFRMTPSGSTPQRRASSAVLWPIGARHGMNTSGSLVPWLRCNGRLSCRPFGSVDP